VVPPVHHSSSMFARQEAHAKSGKLQFSQTKDLWCSRLDGRWRTAVPSVRLALFIIHIRSAVCTRAFLILLDQAMIMVDVRVQTSRGNARQMKQVRRGMGPHSSWVKITSIRSRLLRIICQSDMNQQWVFLATISPIG
jgi:hypothetical protein